MKGDTTITAYQQICDPRLDINKTKGVCEGENANQGSTKGTCNATKESNANPR